MTRRPFHIGLALACLALMLVAPAAGARSAKVTAHPSAAGYRQMASQVPALK
jgi:hypothetical protein